MIFSQYGLENRFVREKWSVRCPTVRYDSRADRHLFNDRTRFAAAWHGDEVPPRPPWLDAIDYHPTFNTHRTLLTKHVFTWPKPNPKVTKIFLVRELKVFYLQTKFCKDWVYGCGRKIMCFIWVCLVAVCNWVDRETQISQSAQPKTRELQMYRCSIPHHHLLYHLFWLFWIVFGIVS